MKGEETTVEGTKPFTEKGSSGLNLFSQFSVTSAS